MTSMMPFRGKMHAYEVGRLILSACKLGVEMAPMFCNLRDSPEFT